VKDNTPSEVLEAMEYLLQTANKHHAHIAGFIWRADEPTFMARLANMPEDEFSPTLLGINQLANAKVAQGLQVSRKVGKVV